MTPVALPKAMSGKPIYTNRENVKRSLVPTWLASERTDNLVFLSGFLMVHGVIASLSLNVMRSGICS